MFPLKSGARGAQQHAAPALLNVKVCLNLIGRPLRTPGNKQSPQISSIPDLHVHEGGEGTYRLQSWPHDGTETLYLNPTMQGGFTLLNILSCAVTLFVKVRVQEFPFLHVFVSCFFSSLWLRCSVSSAADVCDAETAAQVFCVAWARRVASTQAAFPLYQAKRGRVPAASRRGTIHSPPSPFTPHLERLKLRRTADFS